MNTIHLNKKELYSMIVEPDTVDENLQKHLKKCRDCQKRLKRMEDFLQAYKTQGERTEINWIREKGKILLAVSDYHTPIWRLRWGTAIVLSFLIVTSAFLLHEFYFQRNNVSTVEETELQKEVWFFPESIREAELPQNIVFLTEWEGEDFRQFLNFFSPIEEERNEKNDSTTNSLRNNRLNQSISA